MASARPPKAGRELGRVGSAGPTVVLIGAVHGNEPAGRAAIERVFASLEPNRLRGRVVGLTGNRRAFEAGVRYLRRDLNRGWMADALRSLSEREPSGLEGEDLEQLELLQALRAVIDDADGPVTFLDLHTMSGPGAPFACMADVLRNRRIAFTFPLTVVLGLEEVIEGSLLGYLCDAGHVGVAVEGGQHRDPAAVDRLEAAAWLTLVAAGVLDAADIPGGLDAKREVFASPARESQRSVVEIRHRHVCEESDGFEMKPGWKSFQPLRRGQVVATDHRGEVRAPYSGLMLLPRYQGSGSDGYFIVRPVDKRWLRLSTRLRRLGLDRALRRVPGIRAHPEKAETFLVDPRWAARSLVVELMQLFGYRRIRLEGRMLAFSRRKPDGATSALPGFSSLDASTEARRSS